MRALESSNRLGYSLLQVLVEHAGALESGLGETIVELCGVLGFHIFEAALELCLKSFKHGVIQHTLLSVSHKNLA